ncbi:Tyrosine-protein phosphatase domain-containing protein [Caenorhabditis elegans]|uniref:Tyrosine-protein phosphatase domain-containing protein n=1 Tax=Caenorhabditis elegans TaxID=6239 RepID=Q18385_CAEEL|nr:Tyrosine-protein phosphatase domain-containing protein [Caenorhabditis elegans]CCD66513.1 Tyrosine-protein phosphatase domain-containing protein [Caenorhabditis elegans]|eukprot:NP_494864.2 Uncharacterized protein CELE_C33F10.8 [Caenorhabditis elegans]
MDKNNELTLPEKTGQDNNQGSKKGQTDSKKKDQGSRKARGNSKKKNHSSKKVVRKTSKKKKNAASPNAQLIPVAKSPGNDKSPAGFGRKKAGENLNEVMKHLRAPTPRAQQELEKTNWKTTTTETEDEDVAGQKYIKFMDQVAFIENGTTLSTFFSNHLMNIAPTSRSDAFHGNTFKNQRKDVPCIDDTRVKLADPNIVYYIHANHIMFDHLKKTYITTQHPLPGTLNDFWAMVADQKVETIVSLTSSSSASNPNVYPMYYPNKPETFNNFGQFFVYCKTVTQPKTKYGCKEYKFELVVQADNEERRSVRLYHYPHWTKNMVPASSKVVLNLVKKIGKKKSQAPVVVQCETGVNQSAELVFVDAMCTLLTRQVEVNFDVLFRQMRSQKALAMTQLLHFLHSIATVMKFIKIRFSAMPSHYAAQMDSILPAISKDFGYNMCIEPSEPQLRSPTMEEIVIEKEGK